MDARSKAAGGPARRATAVTPADLPLRLMSADTTPLYLQIASQIRHLVITQQLVDGTRLPAVRQLADHLQINPGTVVQAYRELANEQLIESVRGRGTIVRSLSNRSADDAARAACLAEAAARLVTRARALGFDANDAWAQLDRALASATAAPVPVVLVALTAAQAHRYADELNTRFAGRVDFHPYGAEDVYTASPALLAEFDLAYTVVTFVTMAPEVERALANAGVTAEIIGITVELSDATVRQLAAMSPKRTYTLVTERRAVPTALAEIALHSGLDAETIDVISASPAGELDRDELAALAASSRIVIFSFGVAEAIAALGLPAKRLIELRFALTSDALDRLDRRWEAL